MSTGYAEMSFDDVTSEAIAQVIPETGQDVENKEIDANQVGTTSVVTIGNPPVEMEHDDTPVEKEHEEGQESNKGEELRMFTETQNIAETGANIAIQQTGDSVTMDKDLTMLSIPNESDDDAHAGTGEVYQAGNPGEADADNEVKDVQQAANPGDTDASHERRDLVMPSVANEDADAEDASKEDQATSPGDDDVVHAIKEADQTDHVSYQQLDVYNESKQADQAADGLSSTVDTGSATNRSDDANDEISIDVGATSLDTPLIAGDATQSAEKANTMFTDEGGEVIVIGEGAEEDKTNLVKDQESDALKEKLPSENDGSIKMEALTEKLQADVRDEPRGQNGQSQQDLTVTKVEILVPGYIEKVKEGKQEEGAEDRGEKPVLEEVSQILEGDESVGGEIIQAQEIVDAGVLEQEEKLEGRDEYLEELEVQAETGDESVGKEKLQAVKKEQTLKGEEFQAVKKEQALQEEEFQADHIHEPVSEEEVHVEKEEGCCGGENQTQLVLEVEKATLDTAERIGADQLGCVDETARDQVGEFETAQVVEMIAAAEEGHSTCMDENHRNLSFAKFFTKGEMPSMTKICTIDGSIGTDGGGDDPTIEDQVGCMDKNVRDIENSHSASVGVSEAAPALKTRAADENGYSTVMDETDPHPTIEKPSIKGDQTPYTISEVGGEHVGDNQAAIDVGTDDPALSREEILTFDEAELAVPPKDEGDTDGIEHDEGAKAVEEGDGSIHQADVGDNALTSPSKKYQPSTEMGEHEIADGVVESKGEIKARSDVIQSGSTLSEDVKALNQELIGFSFSEKNEAALLNKHKETERSMGVTHLANANEESQAEAARECGLIASSMPLEREDRIEWGSSDTNHGPIIVAKRSRWWECCGMLDVILHRS